MNYANSEEKLTLSDRQQWGFTLLELLTSITIITVLAVAATPILQTLPANARLRERSDRLSAQ